MTEVTDECYCPVMGVATISPEMCGTSRWKSRASVRIFVGKCLVKNPEIGWEESITQPAIIAGFP
jgi:hypothetical protein